MDGIDEAVAHINRYGTHHSDAIIPRDESAARSQLMHRAVQGAGGGPSSPLNKLGEFDCEEITLVRSDLRPTGPIYTPLRRAPFMP